MFDVDHADVRDAVESALAEDIGSGDITSQLTVPEDLQARGSFIAKQEPGAGRRGTASAHLSGPRGATVQILQTSGAQLEKGAVIATVQGRARTLLECERVSLNFMQRFSGVATLGRKHVDQVEGTNVRVLDTRKTTPGLRRLEKMAAAAGGVTNHRFGLFDAVLIKNNHITAAGGVKAALAKAQSFPGPC